MSVHMRRLKDNTTQVRTNEKYFIDLLEKCGFATFVKSTKMGTTVILHADMSEIPSNIYKFADYLKAK
jgi:hypothetical protein